MERMASLRFQLKKQKRLLLKTFTRKSLNLSIFYCVQTHISVNQFILFKNIKNIVF